MDRLSVDVGLHLAPEAASRSATGGSDLANRHAHAADNLQAVPHGVGDALHDAAGKFRPSVHVRQADPASSGEWVGVRCPFAGDVRKEIQTVRPCRRFGRLGGDQVVGISLATPGFGHLGLAQRVAVPLQAAARGQDHAHDVPLAGYRRAEGVHPAKRIGLNLVGVSKDDAAGSDAGAQDTAADDAVADRPGGIVATSADDGDAHLQAKQSRPGRMQQAGHLRRLVASGHQFGVDPELRHQLCRPTPPLDVQQQRAACVADLGGELARQPVAEVILRQKDLDRAVIDARFVAADPENLRGRKPRQGGV